jgi:acyl carrier protein
VGILQNNEVNDMQEKFLNILSEVLEIDLDDISEDLKLDEDNWTSIAIISYIDEIFQEYNIELNGEDLENIKTIKDLEAQTFKNV